MTNPSSQDGKQDNLGKQVIVGASWMVVMRWAIRLLGLVSTMILARILTPQDFGIVAIATSYIGIILGVTDLNISQAIIQFKNVERNVFDTAWTLGIIRGVILAVIILASAIPVANIMDEPQLVNVIVALSISALLSGFGNPYFVTFEKDMKFSKLVTLEVTTKIVAVVTTIACAIIFRNYWALIAGMLASTMVRLLFSYILRPVWPKFSFQATGRILGFTIWLSGNRVLTEINTRLYNFVIGAVVGVAPTGKFHMSMELSALVNEFQAPLARVLYNAYSKINDNIERLVTAYVKASTIVFSVVLPAGVGLALVSRDFIFLILGPQWLNISSYFAILCVMVGIVSFVATADSLLIALGRQKLVFYRELILTIVTLITLSVATWYETLMGFVIARFVAGVFWAILTQYYIQRNIKLNIGRRIFARLWRVLLAVMAMITIVHLLKLNYLETMDYGKTILRLILCITVGAISYIGVLLLLWKLTGKQDGPEEWIMKNIVIKLIPTK